MTLIWKHKNLVGLSVERETAFVHPTVPGLRLRAYPSGRKLWQWTRSLNKRPLKKSLGPFPAVDLVMAQNAAGQLNEQFELGFDPTVEPKAEPEIAPVRMTVADAWDNYIEDCIRRGRKAVGKRDQLGKKDIVATIGRKFIANVTADDVRKVVAGPIARGKGNTRGAIQSNAVLRVVKTFLRFCVKNEYDGIQRNPADAVDPITNIKGRKPKRRLTTREMALVVLAARELDRQNEAKAAEREQLNPKLVGRSNGRSTWADIITLLVMNGNRKSEVMEAMGDEWRRDARVWNISGWRYKTEAECVLPVGPTSAAIMDRRANAGEFIIPSQSGVRTGQDSHICERLRSLMAEIGGEPVAKWTMHSIRYGFRSNIRKEGIAGKELAERIIHPKREDDDVDYDFDWGDEIKDALAKWDARVNDEIKSILGLAAVA